MSNYDNVHGVGYSRFKDDANEPATYEREATLEELYYNSTNGEIEMKIKTDDGLLSFSIPVKARLDFNDFKYSLPEIDV